MMGSITESLELVVRNETTGTLDTNISDIEKFITERIKDYAPESYMGDADMAKKDRAELNKGKKTLGETRRAVIDRVMQPYRDFENRCKDLEKLIDEASVKLDSIVKARETEEKDAKRKLIETTWQLMKFDLVPLDKIFNLKWLNKTYKMTDVQNEMKAAVERIYRELQLIEREEDAEVLKAHYLMTLDLAETLAYGSEMRMNKELAQKEEAQRAEREHDERIHEQKKELEQEQKDLKRKNSMASLVAEALEEEVTVTAKDYTLTVSLTDAQLLGLKNYLTMQDIEFECRELEF